MMNRFEFLSKLGLLCSMAIGTCFCISDAHADTKACTQKEAYSAEEESDDLSSWSELYRSYEKYHHCDDGAISEGYSYSVTMLLTSHWDEFASLMRLSARSNQFEDFVISHINETMSLSDAEKIIGNASNKCPNLGEKLCARVSDAAQLAKSRI